MAGRAKEIGFVDGDGVDQMTEFLPRLAVLQSMQVGPAVRQAEFIQAASDPAFQQIALVVLKVDAGLFVDQLAQLLEFCVRKDALLLRGQG